MSVRSAREHAELLVRRLGLALPPVDIEKVANDLGLKLLRQRLGNNISGLLVCGPNGSFIVIQEIDNPVRQRFSIAHELAHAYLRHQFESGEHVHVDQGYRISQRNLKSSTGEDPKEVEANQFAASILMPVNFVSNEVAKLGGIPLRDDDVSDLASLFQVSEQAMTIRLQTLGYL